MKNTRLLKSYFRFFGIILLIGFLFRTFFALYFGILTGAIDLKALFFGLWFDAAAAGLWSWWAILVLFMGNLLFIKSEWQNRILFILMILFQFVLLADFHYFAEAGRHIQYEVNEMKRSQGELLKVAISYQYSWVYLLVFIFLFRKIKIVKEKKSVGFFEKAQFGSVIIAFSVSVFFARGGFVNIPIDPSQSYRLGDSRQAAIALNGAYSSLFGFLNPQTLEPEMVVLPESVDVRESLKTLYPNPVQELSPTKKANIVLVFLEGWSASFQKSGGGADDPTPFFDELRTQSLTAQFMIAGGHRTTEGVFSTFCSFQNPLGRSVAQSKLQAFDYRCLPRILRDAGWKTTFFQGSGRETSGTGSFAQKLGIEFSYGKEDLHLDHKYSENKWGLQDPDLYKEVEDYIARGLGEEKPLFVALNTNTTHDLVLPEIIAPKFGKEVDSYQYKNVLYFADQALRDFVHKLERLVLEKSRIPTYLVLVADHTAYNKGEAFDQYRIPFLITRLNGPNEMKIVPVAGHRDIAPTLLDLLGGASKSFTGHSLLQNFENIRSDYFHYGTLGWIEGYRLTETSVKNPSSVKCFNLDSLLLKKAEVPCDENFVGQISRALVFTSMSQKRLFSGTTANWNEDLFDQDAQQ